MQANRFSHSAQITVLTAALAFGGSAFAAPGQVEGASSAATPSTVSATGAAATPDAAPHAHHRHGRHHHRGMRDVGLWVPGYGPLNKSFVASLSLTDAQNKLVEEARTEQSQARKSHWAGMKQERQDRMEQLKAGKMDPKAALAKKASAQEQAQAERAKLDAKWLAAWDALDTAQQGKIAQHFSERAEKFAQRAAQRKQHRAEHKADGSKTPSEAAQPVAS